jgi:uncharacterized protein
LTHLLDTNALIAAAWEHHDLYLRTRQWLRGIKSFATCPITQSGFLRISSNPVLGFCNGTEDAFHALDMFLGDERHVFWPDDLSFGESEIRRDLIRGHQQITDKYLAALARHHQGTLATLDEPLAEAFAAEPKLITLIA